MTDTATKFAAACAALLLAFGTIIPVASVQLDSAYAASLPHAQLA